MDFGCAGERSLDLNQAPDQCEGKIISVRQYIFFARLQPRFPDFIDVTIDDPGGKSIAIGVRQPDYREGKLFDEVISRRRPLTIGPG